MREAPAIKSGERGDDTLVGVDAVVLDDHAPAVDGAIDLRLPPHLAQVLRGILPSGGLGLWHGDPQHMACQKLFRGYGGRQGRARLRVARVEQNIGGRDEEDMLLWRQALGEDRALGESAQERVKGLHSFDSLCNCVRYGFGEEDVATIGQLPGGIDHANRTCRRGFGSRIDIRLRAQTRAQRDAIWPGGFCGVDGDNVSLRRVSDAYPGLEGPYSEICVVRSRGRRTSTFVCC